MKMNTAPIKSNLLGEARYLKKYIYKNRWLLVISIGIFWLAYGGWMFNTIPHIDTEPVINSPRSIYSNWLPIGRYGLVLTEYVFGLRWFNPFISTGLGYALLWFSGVLFLYLFERCANTSNRLAPVVSLLIFVSPLVVEQLYFDLQLFQIAWAYCICALATGFTYYGVMRNSAITKILAILCIAWASSSYQIFVVMYSAAVAICFVLLVDRIVFAEKSECTLKYWMKILFSILTIFVIAQILNMLICRMFFESDTSYLDSQRLWGNISNSIALENILTHIVKGFCGKGVFYTSFYGISALCCVSIIAYQRVRSKTAVGILCIMAVLFLEISPFIMTMYMGTEPVPRSQLIYPFVLAGNTFIIIKTCTKKKATKIFSVFWIALLLLQQGNIVTRLIYTDKICAQEDARLANEINQRIEKVSSISKPIAFVGVYNNNLNNACIRGELIGMSIFNCNSETEPHYRDSTSRACNLSRNLALNFQACSEKQLMEARKEALNLPTWPSAGSVVDMGEYTIVKLSDDRWPEDVIG